MKVKETYLVLLFILIPYILTAQSPDGYIDDIRLIPNADGMNLDTIRMKRTHGPLWFGPMGGVNGTMDMGELNLLRKPDQPFDSIYNKNMIDYFPDFGSGYFLGIVADWQPINSYWGGSFRMFIIDNWKSSAFSEEYKDEIKTGYEVSTDFTYLTLSPSVRYNILPNFHFFAGLDVGINLDYTAELMRDHTIGAEIFHEYTKFQYKELNMRFGGHLGLAYEQIILDVNQRMRVKLSPFISVHAGTPMVTDNNSNWNTIMGRIGISFKLGPDVIEYDTIPYVPHEDSLPILLATLDRKRNITFPEFKMEAFTISSGLATVSGGLVEEETTFESAITIEMSAKPDIIKAIRDKVDITLAGTTKPKEKLGAKIEQEEIEVNKKEEYSFNSSVSTDLTLDMKKRFDQMAVYLKNHPNTTIAIIGHSDDQGTFQQNTERSKERAEKVKQYLIKKGIPVSRLLASGKGSIEPIASNKNEAGRKKNRRVEIKIVPGPPKR